MNPDRVYRQYRDDALAEQAGADRYSTFVATPFAETFRYRSSVVLNDVVVAAAREATSRAIAGLRPFADPYRAGQPQGAVEISEEILADILRCHLFVADLTLANSNVLLELGVALGLKPSPQILLLLDGDPVSYRSTSGATRSFDTMRPIRYRVSRMPSSGLRKRLSVTIASELPTCVAT